MFEKPKRQSKGKRKPAVEFVVPFSLQECIYRILETKGKGSRYFVPVVEKLNSECYCFQLQSRRITTRYSMVVYYKVIPVVQIEGYLQALDTTNTQITTHVRIDWFAVMVLSIVLPIVFFIIALATLPVQLVLLIFTGQMLILLCSAGLLRSDYHRLKSLLHDAMSE